MRKRTITIAQLLLVPLLCVVLVQGLLPFSALLASGTRETLQNNSIDIDSHMVENRAVSLEGSMVDQWSSIQKESSYLNATLERIIGEKGSSAGAFLGDADMQREYSGAVFSELLEYLRRDTSCGVFLVLANDGDPAQASRNRGFFLRDSDPTSKTETNSDIYLERGDKSLARSSGITLDTSWSPTFSFQGKGTRAADDYFYEPYCAALSYPNADPANLGFWSYPFVLEDGTVDNHQMITYSVPLEYGGVVYGILGTEVSTSYLANSYFIVQDLDRNMKAGYALAVDQGDGTYRPVAGTGALFDAVRRSNGTFELDETDHDGFFRVADSSVGDDGIFAVTSPLKLYSGNVPYSGTNWVLVGLVSESSVYDLGDAAYRGIFTTIVACFLVGMAVMILVVRRATAPVGRLMKSVRGGIEGLRSFKPSRVREIDELHSAIQSATEAEIETTNQLREEKERYRIAVESSSDVFFTYREDEQTIEIVNSEHHNGVWSLARCDEEIVKRYFSAADREKLVELFAEKSKKVVVEMPIRVYGGETKWLCIHTNLLADEAAGHRYVVGYIRDITERKRREIELDRERSLDPLTTFYRLDAGVEAIEAARESRLDGVLVLVDVLAFSDVVRDFGITFGDVLLEDLATLASKAADGVPCACVVKVRSSADSILMWLGGAHVDDVVAAVESLKRDFSALVRESVLKLRFTAGVAVSSGRESTEVLVKQARAALGDSLADDCSIVVRKGSDRLTGDIPPFSPVVSMGYVRQMNLSSLALNLLDRRFSLTAGLDLLARRLQGRFGLENLIVTSFLSDYLATSVLYAWRPVSEGDETSVYRCSEEDFETLGRNLALATLHSTRESLAAKSLFAGAGNVPSGVAFSISEDGVYAGGIVMVGVDEALLQDEAESNALWEVATIIQNRVNQEHLDQSAQAKSDFLARMSHEIRTPMNGIIGMTDIALKEGQTDEGRLECLKKVSKSSRYLLGLLNDILDMSKIESGKMTLVAADFDLAAMLAGTRSLLEAKFKEKNQVYREDIRLSHTWFNGDELRINQIVINFLGNAMKYSDPGSTVTLRVHETPHDDGTSDVLFSVEDEGFGIDEENQKRIFQKFEQVDTTSARQQGTGLGLAICNRLVRMMGSRIELQSEVGRGSTFSFTLRLKTASPREGGRAKPAPVCDLTGRRVLVAEDNELNMEIVTTMLSDLGLEVDGVADGKQALEAFSRSPEGYYDAVILDVMMPVMNGLEAASAIRALDRDDASRVFIAAASANAFDDDIKRSLASGMNAHLSKPIEPDKLAAVLSSALAARK